MHATFEISESTTPTELSAVIAFCLAAGGSLPSTKVGTVNVDVVAPKDEKAPPPPSEPLAASAVAAPAPPSPDSNGAVLIFDKAGIPWDARIHATTKGTKKDGTFMRGKNVDDAVFDSVMAELRAAHPIAGAALPAPTQAPPPPVDTAPASPAATPVAEPAAAPAPPPPEPSAPTRLTFPQLVAKCDAANGGEGYSFDTLDEMAKSIGLDNFKDLLKKPEMIRSFEMLIS